MLLWQVLKKTFPEVLRNYRETFFCDITRSWLPRVMTVVEALNICVTERACPCPGAIRRNFLFSV